MKTTLVCMSASLLLLAGTAPAALRVYDGFYYQGWDEIRVGLSWPQVAPFVPEPVLLLPLLLCSLRLKC